jgi:CO/xanthine dehydrogenase FAD-binding subunit
MEVLMPRGLEEALELKAAHPEAVPIAGGTDLMVDLNFDRSRPEVMIDVSRLPELNTWRREDGNLFLGAGLTYTRALHELPEMRALAQASRSVGSPQIRNRGTIGGNLGTAWWGGGAGVFPVFPRSWSPTTARWSSSRLEIAPDRCPGTSSFSGPSGTRWPPTS